MKRITSYWLLLPFMFGCSFCIAQSSFHSRLKTTKDFKVIIFIGLECPISQKYMKKIEELKNQYSANTEFFLVVPEKVSSKQIKDFKSEYNSSLSFIEDRSLDLTSQLKAKVTPEVFLFDKSNQLKYRGAIDNWFYELGKYRREANEHYLVDAINACLLGNEVSRKETEAIGCQIQMPVENQHHH